MHIVFREVKLTFVCVDLQEVLTFHSVEELAQKVRMDGDTTPSF